MEQLSIDVPNAFRTEEIDLDRIVTTGEMSESVFMNIFRSLSTINRVFQPVLVVEEGETYRLVFGQRRVLAARKAGHTKILAIIFDEGTPEEVLGIFLLIENLNRSPNPAAEAEALSKVMTAYKWSKTDVTRNLGIKASLVSSRVKLLDKLVPEAFQQLKEGNISLSVAKRFCKLPAEKQRELLRKERVTLEEADDAVRETNLEELIPDELFRLPEDKAGPEAMVEVLLKDAISSLEEAIAITENGRKGKLEKALKVLKGV